MFKIKSNDKWWKVSIIALGIFGLLMFIITSIPCKQYDLDYYISKWMGELSKYSFLKYFSYFYYQVGWTQIIFVLACHGLIIVETLYAYKIATKNQKWIKFKNTIWIFYVVVFLIWLGVKINNIALCFSKSDYGSTVDFELILSKKSELAPQLILFFMEAIVFGILVYALRFKFSKRNDILIKRYWVISCQSLLFILLCYIVIVFLKQSTGRPEGVNTFFDEIIGSISYDENGNVVSIAFTDEFNHLENLGVHLDEFKQYVIDKLNSGDYLNWGPTKYFAWYQINGTWWGNLKYWQPFLIFDGANLNNAPTGYQVNDFPSGHTFTSFLFLTMGLYAKDSKNKKIQIWLKVGFVFVIIHTFLMMFCLQIARVHWAADVYFTCAIQVIIFFLAFFWGKLITTKWNTNFNAKHNIKNELFVRKNGKKYIYYFNFYSEELIIRQKKEINSKLEQKLAKKYKCEIQHQF